MTRDRLKRSKTARSPPTSSYSTVSGIAQSEQRRGSVGARISAPSRRPPQGLSRGPAGARLASSTGRFGGKLPPPVHVIGLRHPLCRRDGATVSDYGNEVDSFLRLPAMSHFASRPQACRGGQLLRSVAVESASTMIEPARRRVGIDVSDLAGTIPHMLHPPNSWTNRRSHLLRESRTVELLNRSERSLAPHGRQLLA